MEWTTDRIRQTFLDYFQQKEHQIVASAPIVIKNDPTLMFTNAGMNQFKGIFLGNTEPKAARVADSQKCLRVSGKHNDLEEVGKDHYHHTMFEMLGNWSFGDYFKKEAIDWAWDLLTNVYQLDRDRLYVSVFAGDEELNLALDEEARDHWQAHLPAERILACGKKDNFWEMGETGPCGPCSEIHIDLRSEKDRAQKDGAALVNADHPEVIEIWNLVFMEFNKLETGELVPLKAKHIDTGMGLERLARVLQGVSSNYDTDVFKSLIDAIVSETGVAYRGTDDSRDVAARVIADHVRTVAFSIADTQLPSNNGAGYVIRRVLRRAIRYGYSQLNMNEPFIYKVAGVLVTSMGEAYPELVHQKSTILKVVEEEEKTFLKTLAKGLDRMEAYVEDHKNVDGKFAFELYDTYGFPIDLTRMIAEERGMPVDEQGFERELQQQKERSRSATKVQLGDWTMVSENDDRTGTSTSFIGYDHLEAEVRVLRFRSFQAKGKTSFHLVLDQTPFYAEGGGQIGDTGTLTNDHESIRVLNTIRENGEFIHVVDVIPENPLAGFTARVDRDRRREITKHHSATHFLHHILRELVGTHVEQRGSLVAENKLRFDFSHFEKLSVETLEQIERSVNEMIKTSIPLNELRSVPIDEAKSMGAMALFGEKYGDEVRVIRFGPSVELCGGTHVESSELVGGFKITSEGSVASGIRRIEAISGAAHERYVNERLEMMDGLTQELGTQTNPLEAVQKLKQQVKDLESEVVSLKQQQLVSLKHSLESSFQMMGEIQVLVKRVDGMDGKAIKDLCFQLTNECENRLVVLGAAVDEKVNLGVAMSKALLSALNFTANDLIKQVSPHIEGGGGGQPFMAMAGGKNKKGLDRALENAIEIIEGQVAS